MWRDWVTQFLPFIPSSFLNAQPLEAISTQYRLDTYVEGGGGVSISACFMKMWFIRCEYLQELNIAGLDEHSTPPDYNDFMHR
jgi:hypothetical protein